MTAKTNRLWMIPGIFFLLACCVNLYGCASDNLLVERYVKGALMPLLALTGLAFLAPRKFDTRVAGTLLLAQLFGWAGDSLLLGSGFAWFATGIGFFMLGHVCYICLFCRSLKGLSAGKWIVAAVVMAAMLTGVVVAIGIKGVLLAPMALYGGELLVISFCGLCGICRRWGPSRGVWWMVLLGGLLFLFSDSLIAMRTFDEGYFAWRGFVIMLTYLAAQSLLCAAAVKIAITKDPA